MSRSVRISLIVNGHFAPSTGASFGSVKNMTRLHLFGIACLTVFPGRALLGTASAAKW